MTKAKPSPIESPFPCSFTCGPAGSGKTYRLQQQIIVDPTYAELCATTGVAAVNLGGQTINSRLGYFDTDSMRDSFISGKLLKRLAEMAHKVRNIAIDEVPMMDAAQLDILYDAVTEINQYATVKYPFGIILVGDPCQLRPVKGRWMFEAKCWPSFDANTVVLRENWRQTDDTFLRALGAIRAGDGLGGVQALREGPTQYAQTLDRRFTGTTIVATNEVANRFNQIAYSELPDSEEAVLPSYRWGDQRAEWSDTKGLIPNELKLKVGALVMVLVNDAPQLSYVNGDCGYVKEFIRAGSTIKAVRVALLRTGRTVDIPARDLLYQQREQPNSIQRDPIHAFCACASGATVGNFGQRGSLRRALSPPWNEISLNCAQDQWIVGAVRYFPLRLAYASTVHKVQGLSLDRVQVDLRGKMFEQPAMVYTALSRCRTPEGLRIVGSPDLLIKRTRCAPEVERWLNR